MYLFTALETQQQKLEGVWFQSPLPPPHLPFPLCHGRGINLFARSYKDK